MRSVIVASGASNRPVRINNFQGETWGDLKSHPDLAGLVSSNVEAVLREGNVTLNRTDAQLPQGDFTVYLVPTRNKAGASNIEAVRAISEEVATAIRAGASICTDEDIEELKDLLLSEIDDFFQLRQSSLPEETDSWGTDESSSDDDDDDFNDDEDYSDNDLQVEAESSSSSIWSFEAPQTSSSTTHHHHIYIPVPQEAYSAPQLSSEDLAVMRDYEKFINGY